MPSPIIQAQNLSKSFGKHTALDQVNFNVHEGDFCAFIGPNGAGKSTTIRILLGLIKASSGQAQVFNQTCSTDQARLMHRIGYLPSEAPLYKSITVTELLNLSRAQQASDCQAEQKRLIDLFELNPSARIQDLSLGNRKKLAIITALHHRPELYILDEPTSGLDPIMQDRFWQEMTQRHHAGATIFTSSHDLAEVQKYCHQVVLIRQGQIVFHDSLDQLLSDNYKQISLKGQLTKPDLAGISNWQIQDNNYHFRYQGTIKDLLQALNHDNQVIEDISITPPTLDSLLHQYYQAKQKED